jgi:hypothetical protein
MGNPCRYIFQQNTAFVGRPEIDEENKKVVINFYKFRGEREFKDSYDQAVIDLYSAADVIFTYTNGNTNKDEFRRLARWDFNTLKLSHQEDSLDGDYTKYVYAYESLVHNWYNWPDPESETDIPIGKFAGKTYEEVQHYNKENKLDISEILCGRR